MDRFTQFNESARLNYERERREAVEDRREPERDTMDNERALDVLREIGYFGERFMSLRLTIEQFDAIAGYVVASGKSPEEALAELCRREINRVVAVEVTPEGVSVK